MALLGWARLLVAWAPFDSWQGTLGYSGKGRRGALGDAKGFAADVEWAARRLPFDTKCLPRAMALSWLLRRRAIGHGVVVAVRPAALRDLPDALHAWVEVDGERIIGDLPGPWIESLRIGA